MKSTGFLATFRRILLAVEGVLRHGPRSADNAPDMLIPHMDLSVTDTAYKATVELPGVAQDQVNIEVRDNMLIVEGEKKKRNRRQGRKEGLLPDGALIRLVPPRALPARGRRNRQDHRDPQGWRVEHRDSPQGTEKPAARKIEVVKGE